MTTEGIFRRRHLPHWDVAGKPVFITACLNGSIPASGLIRVQEYRAQLAARPRPQELSENEWEHQKHKLEFAFFDNLLDHESLVQSLVDDRQAKIVQDAFLHFAGQRYTLLAFVVMPSHHHWLLLPNEDWFLQNSPQQEHLRQTPRQIISHSIQSYTATQCNRIRGQTGAYWQSETFDHWVRSEEEMIRIINYIENNPVKAGLTNRPENWRWSSARIRASTAQKLGEPITTP